MIRKLALAILTCLILLNTSGLTFLMTPPRAYAVIPVIDVPNTSFNIWEELLRVLLQVLKRRLLDVMVDQIVDWIQGGSDKKPQFITDWKGFLEDAGQQAVGQFAQETFGGAAGFLCKPFQFQMQLSFLTPTVPKFSKRIECTLNKIVKNIEDFNKDFRKGGWLAFSTAAHPQNNFFGGVLMGIQEKETRRSAAQIGAYAEGTGSGGFLSAKKCKKDPVTGKDIDCEIVTPGSAVGNVVSKAVGSDIDYILSAQELGDYVAAIVNAAINRVIKEGLSRFQKTTGAKQVTDAQGIANQLIIRAVEQNRGPVIDDINLSLKPRQEAVALLDDGIQLLTRYINEVLITSKEKISKPEVKNICTLSPMPPKLEPLKPTGTLQTGSLYYLNVLDDINLQITTASTTIAEMQADKAEILPDLAKLLDARQQVEALGANSESLAEMATIRSNVTDLLDPDRANEIRSDADQTVSLITASFQPDEGERFKMREALDEYLKVCKQ